MKGVVQAKRGIGGCLDPHGGDSAFATADRQYSFFCSMVMCVLVIATWLQNHISRCLEYL